MTLTVTPLDAPLGAEVHGFDFAAPLDATVRDELIAAIDEHLLLLFRNGDALPDEPAGRRLCTAFGPPRPTLADRSRLPGFPGDQPRVEPRRRRGAGHRWSRRDRRGTATCRSSRRSSSSSTSTRCRSLPPAARRAGRTSAPPTTRCRPRHARPHRRRRRAVPPPRRPRLLGLLQGVRPGEPLPRHRDLARAAQPPDRPQGRVAEHRPRLRGRGAGHVTRRRRRAARRALRALHASRSSSTATTGASATPAFGSTHTPCTSACPRFPTTAERVLRHVNILGRADPRQGLPVTLGREAEQADGVVVHDASTCSCVSFDMCFAGELLRARPRRVAVRVVGLVGDVLERDRVEVLERDLVLEHAEVDVVAHVARRRVRAPSRPRRPTPGSRPTRRRRGRA